LFYDTGALSHEYTIAFIQLVRSMGRMPDLPALQHIYNVIIVAPEVFKFVPEPAIVQREQRIPAGKPLAAAGVIGYM